MESSHRRRGTSPDRSSSSTTTAHGPIIVPRARASPYVYPSTPSLSTESFAADNDPHLNTDGPSLMQKGINLISSGSSDPTTQWTPPASPGKRAAITRSKYAPPSPELHSGPSSYPTSTSSRQRVVEIAPNMPTSDGGLHGHKKRRSTFQSVQIAALRFVPGIATRVWPLSALAVADVRRGSTSGATHREKKKESKLDAKGRRRRWDLRIVLLFLVVGLLAYRRFSRGEEKPSMKDSIASQSSAAATAAKIIKPTRKSTLSNLLPFRRRSSSTPAPDLGPLIYRGLPEFAYNGSAPRHQIEDALLHVDMDVPTSTGHPIFQLIKDSRDAWEEKKERQSKTLKEAVAEYKRRNQGMNPPKGFDKWWNFVRNHDVQLPDEYDQINRDMYLYRALSPRDLRQAIDEASDSIDTFTITIHRGALRTRSMYRDDIFGAFERLDGQATLLTEFGITKWLPDVKVVFGVHDTPTGFLGWDHRQDLMERIEDDEYYQLDSEEIDVEARGWAQGCPHSSAARSFDRFAPLTGHGKEDKTLIADHFDTFDLCKHPESMSLHGVTSGRSPHVQAKLSPIWSLSKTTLNTDVLGVPVEQWVDTMPAPAWKDKADNRLMWRGSNTGTYHSKDTTWRASHRARLVGMSGWEASGDAHVLSPPTEGDSRPLKATILTANIAALNKGSLDVAFSGVPIQCDVDDGTCEDISEEYDFDPKPMTHDQALQYKYIVDVDGNAWSARTKRLFAGGSLIFKTTIMPEWWSQRVQPWVHYVPVQVDYSDLHDILTFFRGDVYGRGGQTELAEHIALAGLHWSKTHWRKVDMAAYTARLYLEWARLMTDNRSSMDFIYKDGMEPDKTAAVM